MTYQSQRMTLKLIRTVQSNENNEICICRDERPGAKALYTVLVIKDHTTVRSALESFRLAETAGQESPLIESFSDKGVFCLVFPYRQERPLKQFYTGKYYTLSECETICRSLILSCITSGMPYPLLYLMLRQGQVHLAKDHSVYLGYQIDLRDLDISKGEADCAVECAKILRSLLKSKSSQKAFSYRLLGQKIDRGSYTSFTELYKDLQIAAAPEQKKGIVSRIRGWFLRRQNGIFRLFLVLCIVLAVIALLSLFSQLFFGDVPWLRLFKNGFLIIGTESLTQ